MDRDKIIDFLRYRFVAIGFSLVLFVIFVSSIVSSGGINWGIDFVGGVKITAKFEQEVTIGSIRDVLARNNISGTVQQIGKDELNEYIISTKLLEKGESAEASANILTNTINSSFKNVEVLGTETVGPAIGAFLKKSAIKLFGIALLLMMFYLSFRFEVKYSFGAITAVVHDILLSFAFCGFANIEIDIPVIAAVLTIFGYSVNDTIVIFDRIRENNQIQTKQTLFDIVNKSITQSIARTLLTSITTLFAVLALYLLGGEVISGFAAVLLFGIFIGTYSTIYIASPVVLGWEKLVAKKKKSE
ncbi:MAG: protein translocase subunit SecF [Spirochaetota bacterium]